MLSSTERAALDAKILRLADDEFILGHRNSEWAGHGPILEEDIAFANLAIDELGHGILWYRVVSTLREEDPETFPDKLVYQRRAQEFCNVQVVALPHADWAFSMLRQFLFDAYESVHLPSLAASSYEPIAEAAAKIKQEEVYHLHHTRTWTLRLGLGTDESHRRMQRALDALWLPFQQLFVPSPHEALLVEAGVVPDLKRIRSEWTELVVPLLSRCELDFPDGSNLAVTQSALPSPHMERLIAELQEVSRIAPNAVW
jgi:ring-1,2-phenylacetyl-CoA epoxidase subunit PaaC